MSNVKRELVWKGDDAIVSMMVPADAQKGTVPHKDGDAIRYVAFAKNVKGGVVNFFVHDDNPTRFLGTRISAKAAIFRKSFADGRSFLYVDLKVVEGKPTHRLVATAMKEEDLMIEDLFVVFETPPPLVGTIVIAPIASKILAKAPVVEAQKPTSSNVTNIRRPAAVVSSPATSESLKGLATKWNGSR